MHPQKVEVGSWEWIHQEYYSYALDCETVNQRYSHCKKVEGIWGNTPKVFYIHTHTQECTYTITHIYTYTDTEKSTITHANTCSSTITHTHTHTEKCTHKSHTDKHTCTHTITHPPTTTSLPPHTHQFWDSHFLKHKSCSLSFLYLFGHRDDIMLALGTLVKMTESKLFLDVSFPRGLSLGSQHKVKECMGLHLALLRLPEKQSFVWTPWGRAEIKKDDFFIPGSTPGTEAIQNDMTSSLGWTVQKESRRLCMSRMLSIESEDVFKWMSEPESDVKA